jgi:hypothetical protein
MLEGELRTKVLIPLFEAMGYQDVFHHHGGSGEQGKDIVMWKSGDYDERINHGVVVKAGKISGKVGGRSSAGEVSFQIQQCFGGSFRDRLTGEEQVVHKIHVVASGEITKEAKESILNSLSGSSVERAVVFIDGNKLWEQIEKHFPDSRVMRQLNEVKQELDSRSEHYRLVATVGDTISLTAQPKHPGAEFVEPIKVSMRLAFPDTKEGRAARRAVAKHFKTGAPVKIKNSFVTDFELPALVKGFVPDDIESFEIHLGPRRTNKTVVVDIVVTPISGDPLIIDGIEFKAIQAGTDEITFDNAHQAVAWHFGIKMNFRKRRFSFTYRPSLKNQNVRTRLRWLRIQEALSQRGQLSLKHSETGLNLVSANLTKGMMEPPEPFTVAVFQALVEIQARTRTAITIPERDIPGDEAETILRVAQLLRGNPLTATTKTLVATAPRASVIDLLEGKLRIEGGTLYIRDAAPISLADTQIPLPVRETQVVGMTVSEAELDRLRQSVNEEPQSDLFNVTFTPVSDVATAIVRLLPDNPSNTEIAVNGF